MTACPDVGFDELRKNVVRIHHPEMSLHIQEVGGRGEGAKSGSLEMEAGTTRHVPGESDKVRRRPAERVIIYVSDSR